MSQESAVYKICSCLETLIDGKKTDTPTGACKPTNKKEALFNELKKNVHLAFEIIEKYDDLKLAVKQYIQPCYKKKCKTCDYLSFLELCLVLLKLLNAALSAEENELSSSQNKKTSVPKGLLSISQQKVVRESLQFIVALGILPNLLRGIGIPLSRRLEYANVLEHFTSDSTPHQKHVQIVICLETLLNCMERDALQSIILSYHGTDLLAALFQLCHAPIRKIDDCMPYLESQHAAARARLGKRDFAVKLSLIKDNAPYTDLQMTNEILDDRNFFTAKLEKFLKQLCPSLLMWELLLFQGIPVKIDDSEFTIAKVPLWLRKICSQMLTDLILQNHGIASFVQVVLDKAFDVDVQRGYIDSVRMDAVARLITHNPARHISVEDYIQRLSKQVFDLLHLKGSQMDMLLNYVASCIILQFCERDRKSAEQYFLDILLKPLWKCVSITGDAEIVVQEKELTLCIEDIYKIFVTCNSPISRKYIKLLLPFFHCFCNLYFFLIEGMSYLRSKVKGLLSTIFSCSSDEEALSLLHVATFSSKKCSAVYLTTVNFAYGEEGGVGAVRQKEDDFSDIDVHCHAILELLTELKNKNLNRAYLLLILEEFCSFHKQAKEGVDDAEVLKFRFLFTALLQELSGWDVDIGEALMSNISEVIDLLVILLESVCDSENETTFFGEETVMMVLMILNSLIVNDTQLTSSDWISLKKCLPSLQKLRKNITDSCFKRMLFSLIAHIGTHGAAGKDKSNKVLKEFLQSNPEYSNQTAKASEIVEEEESLEQDETRINSQKSLIKTTSESSVPVTVECSKQTDQSCINIKDCASKVVSENPEIHCKPSVSKPSTKPTPFHVALRDIKDQDIPIRGHGLICLGNLLRDHDKETLSHKKALFKILEECLKEEDTYIYLPAIQGLTFLAEADAELVIPALINLFQNPTTEFKFVLKVGEALRKICPLLGDMAYKYKDQLLHTFLSGAKHEDPQIRSSSLSNLGEACSMCLQFNIDGHVLQEILICVLSLLQTDKDLEVRSCAVLVITLLVRGFGKDLLQGLGNDIKSIYDQLKIIYNGESDEKLRLHAQTALEDINGIMKELLTKKLPLSKEIRILQ